MMAQRASVGQLHDLVQAIQPSIDDLKKRFEDKISTFSTAVNELTKIQEDQKILKEKVKRHSNDIDNIYDSQNDLEQYSKNFDIEIKGIPYAESEDCKMRIMKIGEVVGCEVRDEDLDGCHMLRKHKGGPEPSSIITRFFIREKKHILMKMRKTRWPLYTKDLNIPGDSKQVFLNDHLTLYNRRILCKTVDLKVRGKFTSAWTNRGKIFVKNNANDKPILVRVSWDLNGLCGLSNEN
ncbi:hypothetical protein PR048_004571 [Dryococelus australis]|uniref:Uncharacterized protein n=1 Tax=Dryococelus australis TaxID=614101 RepID=A0ABQ9I5T1_9NEOP|nr:hypothetical protein PR048_004571 [Dryococelus australis]